MFFLEHPGPALGPRRCTQPNGLAAASSLQRLPGPSQILQSGTGKLFTRKQYLCSPTARIVARGEALREPSQGSGSSTQESAGQSQYYSSSVNPLACDLALYGSAELDMLIVPSLYRSWFPTSLRFTTEGKRWSLVLMDT